MLKLKGLKKAVGDYKMKTVKAFCEKHFKIA